MKHVSTRAMFDYWTEKRGNRPAPERAEIDPGAIRYALGDTFILATDFAGQLRFRLAGTRVCALFGREIKGEKFSELWSEQSGQPVLDLLAVVDDETVGAVAGLIGRTADGTQLDLEMLLLPLAHFGHARVRAIGVLAPLVAPYWLGEKPVIELELGTLRHLGSELRTVQRPRSTPSNEDVQLRHGFVIYRGGREAPPGERTG